VKDRERVSIDGEEYVPRSACAEAIDERDRLAAEVGRLQEVEAAARDVSRLLADSATASDGEALQDAARRLRDVLERAH
jgi:hypothetical protein